MKVVLDTNVLMSGVCFGGVPGEVLEAWSRGRITLVVSSEIVNEYRRVGDELEERYGEMGFSEVLALVVREAEILRRMSTLLIYLIPTIRSS